MEDGESGFLLESLSGSGVGIPNGVTSIQHLTPHTFFSICSQSLHIINQHLLNPIIINNNNNNNNNNNSNDDDDDDDDDDEIDYSTLLSMADRFKVCSRLAAAVTALGFSSTFHTFMYPSEEDYYKLIRFFVRKLSELPPQQLREVSSDKRVMSDLGDTSSDHQADKSPNNAQSITSQDLKMNSGLPESTNYRSRTRSQDSSYQEEVSYATAGFEGFENLKISKEVEQEIEAVLSETKKREEELRVLLASVNNQQKVAPSRRSYIQRITEITKNSRKQDADIERILKDTRELQLESNYIRERLNRTYAVVDETLFREGKNDPVGRQAYRLLTSIHESFEQISDKILSTDRLRRETVEYEAKLSALSKRSFNVEKLQADFDAIRRENDFLERHGDNKDDSRIL